MIKVKAVSANQGMRVNIEPFFRGGPFSKAQQRGIIEPLLEAQIVFPASLEKDAAGTLLTTVWRELLYWPPTHLVLSDRDWTRMVHSGISAQQVLHIERIEHLTSNSINSGGGAIINPTQAGEDAKVRVGPVTTGPSGTQARDVAVLINALRADARGLDDSSKAEVRQLADKLDDEIHAETPDEDRVDGMINRAGRIASGLGTAAKTTTELLKAWGVIPPQ